MTSIGDALRTFGVSETSTTVLVAAFDPPIDAFLAALTNVRGKRVPVHTLDFRTDDKDRAVVESFRISQRELGMSTIEGSILTRLAVKDCL